MTDLLAELLPCPWCGGKDNLGRVYSGTHDEYYVQCFDCDAHGPVHADDNDACVAWNTRHQSAEIAQAVRDAERYRWLRVRLAGAEHVHELEEYNQTMHSWLANDVDQAIDDSMQETGR